LDYVIIDTLHLFSRISDNLIELLLRELWRQDAIDKRDTLANGFAREKFKHMAACEKLLQDLGISFEWQISPDTRKARKQGSKWATNITFVSKH